MAIPAKNTGDILDNTWVDAVKADVDASTAHAANTSNPHSTTAAQVGAYSTGETDTLLAAKADASALSAHTGNTSNPHGTTAAQVGALTQTQGDARYSLLSHTHTASDLPRRSGWVEVYEDFIAPVTGSLASNTTGTGANLVYTQSDDGNHPGIVQCQTGTTSTGVAGVGASNNGIDAILLGYGSWLYETVLRIPTLSDGTETFTVRAGFADNRSSAGTDGVHFRYTHGTNSGKWEAVTRSNSVETATDTGVTATAGAWVKLGIEINAAATSVTFYIGGALVATNTTNIPSGAGRQTAPMTLILKSAGTTSRSLDIDYIHYRSIFTAAR